MEVTLLVGNAGDGDELPRWSSGRSRRQPGTEAAGCCDTPPLSMTWPSGCALDWQDRERVRHAALQRCNSRTTAGPAGTKRREPTAAWHSLFTASTAFHCSL